MLTAHDEGGNACVLCGFQDLGHAYAVGEVDGRDVHGIDQGLFEGDFAAAFAFIVLRCPATCIGLLFIAQKIGWFEFVFKGGDIDEWLECGARLTDHLDSAVEVVFAAAADHGFDLACADFDGHESALRLCQALGVFGTCREVVLQRIFSVFLHIQIEGGVNLESFFVNGIRAILVADGLNDVADEVGSCVFCRLGRLRFGKVQVGLLGSGSIGFGNVAVLSHLIEDDRLAVLRCFYASEWRVVVRAVRKSCQQSALRERQILHVLAEVDAGCGLDAVAALAEVDLVHVHFKNLLLGVLAFDFKSEDDFKELSLQCLFLCQECISCELLGDGRTALSRRIAGNHVRPDGTENTARIDAMVFIETDIFRCHECILQILRHFADRYGDTVFLRMHRRNQAALRIINTRRRIRRNISRHIRKLSGNGHKKSRSSACSCDKENHDKKYDNLLEHGRFFLGPFSANVRVLHKLNAHSYANCESPVKTDS